MSVSKMKPLGTNKDSRYLKPDQTTPQTIVNWIPLLTGLTPTTDYDIATKKYVDDNNVEWTNVLSTWEAWAIKFLRENWDGTSSWQLALTSQESAILWSAFSTSVIARNWDWTINTITYATGRVITYTYSAGIVTSYTDTVNTWTINRTDDLITWITVT